MPHCDDGLCIFPDGSYYKGRFRDGHQDGEGKLTNPDSSYSYEGQWKKGLPHGKGKEIIGNNVYEGNFINGEKNGKGLQQYGDGSHYEGEFHHNLINGEGEYYCKNNYWRGKWVDGYLEGPGKQIIAKEDLRNLNHASEYVGDFQKGERSGHGTFKWNNNYQYEGRFKRGQLDG